jgi:hypothetical protein
MLIIEKISYFTQKFNMHDVLPSRVIKHFASENYYVTFEILYVYIILNFKINKILILLTHFKNLMIKILNTYQKSNCLVFLDLYLLDRYESIFRRLNLWYMMVLPSATRNRLWKKFPLYPYIWCIHSRKPCLLWQFVACF